jgi:uncharacterized damage-inducible protein DinB
VAGLRKEVDHELTTQTPEIQPVGICNIGFGVQAMQTLTVDWFLQYLAKVHQRTTRVAQCIPPDRLEWSFREGKFTLGDLVRHVAAVERYMFAENIQGQPSRYAGCGRDLADGYEAVMTFRETLHAQTLDIISRIGDEGLEGKCTTPDEARITIWKWLRLMAEHEIHHRGQIYLYLAMLGVKTPPLYGLTSEELHRRSAKP